MSSNFKNLYTSNNPPLQATLMRGTNIESIHKIHAVISDKKGRVLMCAGNPEYKSFIRSALKPFQAIPFVSSGAGLEANEELPFIIVDAAETSVEIPILQFPLWLAFAGSNDEIYDDLELN